MPRTCASRRCDLYDPLEQTQVIGGIRIFYGLFRPAIRPVAGKLTLDASGGASLQLNNGSGSTGVWAFQALFFGANGPIQGSTTAAFL